MIRYVIIIMFSIANLLTLYGQSEATYSQYMFNGLAINPAYAGVHEALSISALSRFQSIGVDGAPKTQTITAHTGLKNQKVGLGLLIINDKIGVTRQTGFYFSYAFKIKAKKSTLSLGLQGGGTQVDADYSQLRILQPGDPKFAEDAREFNPNFGAGIYYHREFFYAGLSMPQMLDLGSKVEQIRPIIFTSGAVFTLNPVLKLKPNILLRLVEGVPVELNYNMNLLIHDILWLGVSYRPSNTIIGLIEIQLTDQLRLGYAYDANINDFGEVNSGSHEILINYFFRFTKKGVVSPRYF